MARVTALCCLHGRLRLAKGDLNRVEVGQTGIEVVGKCGGHLVVNGLRRSDNDVHTGIQQTLRLRLGGAAVEKDQLETALVTQKCGQPTGMGWGGCTMHGFEQ